MTIKEKTTDEDKPYLILLEKLNTFIIDHHDDIDSALIMMTSNNKSNIHKGVTFFDGDINNSSNNLVISISHIPEILEIFVLAVIKGGLKADYNRLLLLHEIKRAHESGKQFGISGKKKGK